MYDCLQLSGRIVDDRLTALAISRSGENCTDLCMESPIKKKKKTKKKKKDYYNF